MLFINASKQFEKGKKQNILTDEHIQAIIDTYQFRKEKERYSRRVEMAEIEKNEYNLNISRYIDMTLPEKPIDLQAVNKELFEIEKIIQNAREKHNEFLRELGLPEI